MLRNFFIGHKNPQYIKLHEYTISDTTYNRKMDNSIFYSF